MPRFKQAPHDQAKADMAGVGTYIPKRSEPDRSHTCEDCDLTARWELTVEGETIFACDEHRKDYLFTATNYTEKHLR